MNRRLIKTLSKANIIHDLAMIDAYNQYINYDIACAILTNIDTANNHFIMEKIEIVGRKHKGQSGVIYGTNGISPTITTLKGEGAYIQVEEPQVLTNKRTEDGKRLRKDYEAGKLNIKRKYMQRLEPRKDGLSNTLTSVQKDNLVIEPNGVVAAQRGREPIVLGWTRDSKGNIVNRHPVDVANTITSAKRDNTQNYVVIPANTKDGYIECEVGGVIDVSYPTSKTRRGRVQDGGKTTPALTCATESNLVRIEDNYRIRKLTERERFRLMGVNDTDSDKIREVVSKSQCYKLAGNSIVVDVLAAIFQQLFTENKTTDRQLKLF